MATLTTRELRVVAAIIETLTKARTTNARLGVPTTPDVFSARFPCGFDAVLRWTPGVQSRDPERRRALERSARHRPGYVLDLDTPFDPDTALTLPDPQGAKRVEICMEGSLGDITEYVRRAARNGQAS